MPRTPNIPNESSTASPDAPAPYSEESFIPVATAHTRAMRSFLPWQLWRFVVINLRMLRMIAKSHE
ncbi:MAG: hypothetical protein ABI910_22420 [Gemmatimonadota bacterium]